MSWQKIAAIALSLIVVLIVCLTFEVWAAAFLGFVFALSLNGPAQWIRSKWHMPAWLSTVLVMLMVLVVVTGLGFVIGPPLVGQADELEQKLPAAMEKSLDWLRDRKWGRNVLRHVKSFSGASAKQPDSEGETKDKEKAASKGLTEDAEQQKSDESNDKEKGSGNDAGTGTGSGSDTSTNSADAKSIILPVFQTLINMLSVTTWTFMLVLVSFVITLYIALDPDVYHRGILWLIPAEREALATTTMSRMAVALRWWILGRLCSMLVVGLLTSLGMWIIGMPAPLALGALAGILSFVPNIGPIVAAAPGLLLAVPDGSWMILSALGVYLVAQIIESNVISPLVDQFTVTAPPAILIFVQVIMGVLAGAWGVVVATPLLVVVMVMTQQLYVREYIKKPIKVIGSNEDETPEKTDNDQAAN